jgi:cobalt/nickel transport system permease protein
MKSLEQGHVPNMATILYYSERGGPLNKFSPWTKLIGLILFVVAATIIQSFYLLFSLYLLSVLVYGIGRFPLGKLASWSLFPIFFILTVSFLFIFEEPGNVVVEIPGFLALTDGGLMLIAKLILRGLAVVNYSLLFIMSTKYSEIAYLSNKIFPWPFDVIFLLTFRFIFVVFEVIDTALVAAWARGGSLKKGLASMSSLYARIFGIGILYSFDRAERVGKAMEARGFTGVLKSYKKVSYPSATGWLFIMICAVGLIVVYMLPGVFP